ncbi:MAG: copper chaperone PCu(A)C [Gammaproteobacteria bacterium]|nr:copper chaperone PCu(A)C [Gammaproteobacteria bacterium]
MSLAKTISRIFFVSLFSISSANAASAIKIENPWSPEAPPVAKVMAGYMKIYNLSNKDIKIQSAKSSVFKKIEIHLTEMNNGMMRMIKQDNLNIKANAHIELKPGGLHMMLIGKLKPIKSGSIIPLTLSFDNGETVKINLKVKNDNKPQMKCGSGKCGSM